MLDREKIRAIFKLYEYTCLRDENDYMVYAVGRNLYPGVEIVCFNDLKADKIKKLETEFRQQNYSVRVCNAEQASKIEDYLFDWFFQVEQSNKKIRKQYTEYASAVMRAYGIDNNQMSTAHYEYVKCPYTIEKNYGEIKSNSHIHIIKSLRDEISEEGAKLIIVEAPAGYGKTSTSMELLNSYSDVKTKVRPFYMELSRDRQAPTFYYLLVSQINKNFNVLLGDTIVMHNIKEGRIPLIIDGFDELLNEDLDKGISTGLVNGKGKTMLETIADLLENNAKIVLTTRKTAILSGPDFYEWYEQKISGMVNINIVRYKLEHPRIEDWLNEKKMRNLPAHIKDLSNPVILGYLHFLNEDEFYKEAQSEVLVQNYVTRLLTREIIRQNLPFSDLREQKLIYEHIASAFAYDDITSDSRKNIKENILLFSSDVINRYSTPNRDADSIANSLTNHALLDRKGDNNIGFINDFVLGLFIGYSLIDEKNEDLKEYYYKMSSSFIDKVISAMSTCDDTKRIGVCNKLEEQCDSMTPNLRLLAEIKLLHETKSHFVDTYIEGIQIISTKFNSPSTFSNCQFINIEFLRGQIDFSVFKNCTFIGCIFNNVEIIGNTDSIYFFECIKDGIQYEPNAKDDNDILMPETIQEPLTIEILKKYIHTGTRRRKMQIISRLKNDFEDFREFKKQFSSLVGKGYILAKGDQSHISDAGFEYLNKNI